MTVLENVLIIIYSAGGIFHGTARLMALVPAAPEYTRLTLQRARKRRLICSSHSHGGRGHMATHKITQKGLDYVRSTN